MPSQQQTSKTPAHERDEWRTPPWVFDYAESLVGPIEFDAACTRDNALATPLWTLGKEAQEAGDSFKVDDWMVLGNKWIWCNPPYSSTKLWVARALDEGVRVAFLLQAPNGEKYFGPLIAASHEVHFIGRIRFLRPDGTVAGSPPRGSSLFLCNGYSRGTRTVVTRDDLTGPF